MQMNMIVKGAGVKAKEGLKGDKAPESYLGSAGSVIRHDAAMEYDRAQ